MNRINRKLEYALMALKLMNDKALSANSGLTSAKEVAQSLSTPYDVTARVMQVLASGGLLKAEYGAGGGYLLKRNLSEVTLLELIHIIDGPTEIARCLQSKESCDIIKSCNIMTPIQKLNKKMYNFYSGILLSDLFDTTPKARPQAEASHVG